MRGWWVLPDQVAAFLGTEHHEFTFTVEEGIDALYDLIWHIESYEQVMTSLHSGSRTLARSLLRPCCSSCMLRCVMAAALILHAWGCEGCAPQAPVRQC